MFRSHGARFATFSGIGAAVFALGFLVLYVEVQFLGISPGWAYLIQAFVSVAVSFVLNWQLTWRDRRDLTVQQQMSRFAATRVATIPINQLLYLGVLALGVQYLLANVVSTAIFVTLSYVIGDAFVFARAPAREAKA